MEDSDSAAEADVRVASNIDRILAVAVKLEFPDDAATAESTIKDPFPGLKEWKNRERRVNEVAHAD